MRNSDNLIILKIINFPEEGLNYKKAQIFLEIPKFDPKMVKNCHHNLRYQISYHIPYLVSLKRISSHVELTKCPWKLLSQDQIRMSTCQMQI